MHDLAQSKQYCSCLDIQVFKCWSVEVLGMSSRHRMPNNHNKACRAIQTLWKCPNITQILHIPCVRVSRSQVSSWQWTCRKCRTSSGWLCLFHRFEFNGSVQARRVEHFHWRTATWWSKPAPCSPAGSNTCRVDLICRQNRKR